MSTSIHRKELIVIYRQEILQDIRLFSSQPVAKFYDSLFLSLDLSFIPWSVLSAITAGIAGLFYVSPYKDATYAELYDTLAAGMPGNEQQVYEDENSGIYG